MAIVCGHVKHTAPKFAALSLAPWASYTQHTSHTAGRTTFVASQAGTPNPLRVGFRHCSRGVKRILM